MKAAKILDRVLAILAFALLASIFFAAVHDVSRAWDGFYYHLPFAGRLAGVLKPDTFVFHDANQARFEGFPLLGEMLQGMFWRITGRPECANLVAFSSVPLFAWFLKKRFDVPFHLTVIGMFAVPLVQLHASTTYVDLPANVALAVLVLLAMDVWVEDKPIDRSTLRLCGISAAAAINMKFQLHPIALAAMAAIAIRLVKTSGWKTLAVAAVALPLVCATPLKNLVVHHNPYYPERLSIAGHELPGIEKPYSSSPSWLERFPRPVRFAASVMEIGIQPMTVRRRWTVDQWMDDEAGRRLGGFFNAYVLAGLALLIYRAAVDRTRKTRVVAIGFGLLTLLVSLLPQSHELRYYLVWMVVLVAANLLLAFAPRESEPKRWLPGRITLGLTGALALAVVLAVTRFGYAYASGSTFAELMNEKVDAAVLSGVHDGEAICVMNAPWNVLWAPELHPPRHYVVREAESWQECAGYRPIE